MYSKEVLRRRLNQSLPTPEPNVCAFELAREGECRTASQIQQVLQREGYGNLESHFSGNSLSRHLNELMSKGGRH